jgi:2-keto-4-pentenoate hydratase
MRRYRKSLTREVQKMTDFNSADFNSADLGNKLAEARSSRTPLAASSLTTPPDMAAAAQAQAAFFHRCTAEVPAWKVAIHSSGLPVAAPMWPMHAAAGEIAMQWKPGTIVEVEIALRLARDLPAPPRDKPYRRADIVDAIGSLHLGIEVICSRLKEGSKAPFPLFYADLIGNDGYLLASKIENSFMENLEQKSLTILADAKPFYSGQLKHPTTDPLAPVLAYANAPSDALGGFKAGQIITTGSLCGGLDLPQPARLEFKVASSAPIVINFRKS